MIEFLKKLFFPYRSRFGYWVRIEDIIISPEFARTRIRNEKWRRKWQYYFDHGTFESKIILDKDFVLVDGYSSYKIAKELHENYVLIYFETKRGQKRRIDNERI